MVSPFEVVILKLRSMGAFQFLFPFMLTSAVFYGLLRKSQLFGPPEKNVAVNAVVALIAAFMVWAYPIIAGVSIEQQLTIFMFNGSIALLTVMVALMIVSMFFPPDLPARLGERLKGGRSAGALIIFGLIVGISILFSSGLVNVFIPPGIFEIPSDVFLTIITLIILGAIIVVIIAPWGGK
jgi:uncharacterized membrane protein YjfL (UPF0719 family)